MSAIQDVNGKPPQLGSAMPRLVSDQLKPSRDGYGQNGFSGPSSDNPGQRTASGFLPGPGTPVNDQLRSIKAETPPAAFGMKKQ